MQEREQLKNIDISGQKFEMLTVLKRSEQKKRVAMWLCKCDCGNITTVDVYSLIHHKIKSCGCLKHKPAVNAIDHTGEKFGLLTAVERLPHHRGKMTFYRCICECGNEKIVSSGSLASGKVRSCGVNHDKKEFKDSNYSPDDRNPVYLVYRHISPIGKSYVGITSQNPKRRFQNGAGYITQPAFNRAIEKYGWENFKHEILEENLTEKEACEKEDYYIKKFNSVAPNGYNSRGGGIHGRTSGFPVMQYFNNEPVNFFENVAQALEMLNIAPQTIHKYNSAENNICGYHFEMLPEIVPNNIPAEYYEIFNEGHLNIREMVKENARRIIVERNKEGTRPINQYDLDGHYIRTFSSINEAIDSIPNAKPGSFYACINPKRQGDSAYGFMWKYDDGNHDDISRIPYKSTKAVVKIDKKTGEILEEYKSMARAAESLGISMNKVRYACEGRTDKFNSFILKYKYEN